MGLFSKSLDVITLFHKAGSPASIKAQTLLKQISAAASAHATEDQASDHSSQSKQSASKREPFDLEVTEEPPTPDQLSNILQYLGAQKASAVITGAKTEAEALKKLKESGDNFLRPVVVDWSNGRAVAGGNESEILKMVEGLKK